MKKSIFFLAPLLFCVIFFCSCGLESYYVMQGPTTVVHEPNYTSVDFSANYFEFIASPNSNFGNSEFEFLGTAVYYKVYASSSTMLSRQSSISAVNNSTDYSAAAQRMISYGYQQLGTDVGSVQPLISAGLENCNIRIRLTNYGDVDEPTNEFRATIEIREYASSPAMITLFPRRSLGSNKTFDFGRASKNSFSVNGVDSAIANAVPVSGDEDFEDGTVSDNKYYVDLYAVAMGRDTTYTTYYSNVLHLGSVPIDATTENN